MLLPQAADSARTSRSPVTFGAQSRRHIGRQRSYCQLAIADLTLTDLWWGPVVIDTKISNCFARSAVILAILALAGCQAEADKGPKEADQVGRYQITTPAGTTQAILLDTVTGKTWYRVTTGPSDKEDVTQWLSMDKTNPEQWMALNGPRADKPPEGAHPYRP